MIKVLVAEDDKFLASAYRVKLTKSGFDVKIASDGEEALADMKSNTPQAVILDLVMPRRDGYSVLAEIKKNPAWNNIPVIVASNLGQPEDIVKATKLGADDYIVKTDLSMKTLVEKINAMVAKKAPAQAAAPAAPQQAQKQASAK